MTTKHVYELVSVAVLTVVKRRLAVKLLLTCCLPLALWSAQASGQSKKDVLLCSMNNAFYCDGRELACNYSPSSDWNVPLFFEVDLAAKEMRTTKTSGDNRHTPLQLLQHTNGVIYAQGVDKGKGFTLVVTEVSGKAIGSIVTENGSLNLYGACMLLPK